MIARSSDSGFRGKIKASHKMLDSGASHQEREKFLERQGVKFDKNRHAYQIEKNGGDIGTQSYKQDELDITTYLWHGCSGGEYYSELVWEINKKHFDSHGDKPDDRLALGYDDNWWDYASYSVSETSETSEYIHVLEDDFGSGPAFRFEDSAWGVGNYVHYAGVYLDTRGDYDPEDRRIQGGFTHLWEGVGIQSISVGYPFGISVGVDADYKSWRTQTEVDDDTLLRVNQSQSNYCS